MVDLGFEPKSLWLQNLSCQLSCLKPRFAPRKFYLWERAGLAFCCEKEVLARKTSPEDTPYGPLSVCKKTHQLCCEAESSLTMAVWVLWDNSGHNCPVDTTATCLLGTAVVRPKLWHTRGWGESNEHWGFLRLALYQSMQKGPFGRKS